MPENTSGWYLLENNKPVGPMSLANLVTHLQSQGLETLVYGPGLSQWTLAHQVPQIASSASGNLSVPPAPPLRRAHDIEYRINGAEMQYAEIDLDPGETVIAEPGAMMYMTTGIRMETHLGDPNKSGQGFMGKLMSAGKRALTGESLFMTTFTSAGPGKQTVAFASPYPGKILPLHLDELGGEIICQKDAFLAAAKGMEVSIAFQKKIGVALFGGEGFIMQRLKGDGIALIHAGGTLMERVLSPGETLRLDTGCLVAIQPTVSYDIQFTGGIKNTLFGGEGLFLATLTGPGRIWLQSLPFSRLAGRVLANATHMRGGKDEGSVLGGIGLGTLFGGDD